MKAHFPPVHGPCPAGFETGSVHPFRAPAFGKLLLRRLCLLLAGATLSGGRLHAADIFWTTPTTISSDTDVSTFGSLLYAWHFTQSATTISILNGVTFNAFAVSSSNVPITKGSTTLTPGTVLDSTDGGAGATAAPYTGLSTAYRGFLGSGATDFSRSFSLTLGGLTTGQTYRVQIWSSCSSPQGFFFNTPSDNTHSLLTSGRAVTLDMNNTNATGGVGQWVFGTFTADAATETVSFSNPGPNDSPVLNGFQLRVVPEPSASLLAIGSGIALFAGRRRRRIRKSAG